MPLNKSLDTQLSTLSIDVINNEIHQGKSVNRDTVSQI